MAPKNQRVVNAQDLLEQLAENDLRFEIMLTSLIELLKSKRVPVEFSVQSPPAYTSLVTDAEFQIKLDETQKKMVQVMSLAKPSGIIKPDTLH